MGRSGFIFLFLLSVHSVPLVGQMQESSPRSSQPPTDSPLWCRHVILVYVKPSGKDADFWTKENFAWLAAYCDKDGRPADLFFDGFLITGFECKDGRNLLHVTECGPAVKSDWQDALQYYLATARKLSQAFEEVRAKLNQPNAKGKVILAMPCPDTRQRDFGEVNGSALNFAKDEDRIRAMKWYVDTAVAMWQNLSKSGQLNGVELVGFYWGNEGIHGRDAAVAKATVDYVHEKGYLMHWIPYPGGARKDWKKIGFDCVTQQINYQSPYKPGTPLTAFDKRTAQAEAWGMHGMEMCPMARETSLNPRIWIWHQVFLANLDAALRLRWDRFPALTYYHGDHLPKMGRIPQTHVFYEQLHRWVKGRLTEENVRQLSVAVLDELKRRGHIDDETHVKIAAAPTVLERLERMEEYRLDGLRKEFEKRLAAHSQVSGNLLPNGSFENDMVGWPAHSGPAERTQEKARDGQWSLHLAAEPGDGADVLRACAQSANVPVQPGRIVRLSAWLYLPGDMKETERGLIIGLSRYQRGKQVANWTSCEARRTQATKGWEQLSVYLPVDDAPCDEVQAIVGMCGVGAAYVDAVELVTFSKPSDATQPGRK
ncbi:MAG: DUF4855 domain-containing protein [Planctomycetota bacterium]